MYGALFARFALWWRIWWDFTTPLEGLKLQCCSGIKRRPSLIKIWYPESWTVEHLNFPQDAKIAVKCLGESGQNKAGKYNTLLFRKNLATSLLDVPCRDTDWHTLKQLLPSLTQPKKCHPSTQGANAGPQISLLSAIITCVIPRA